MPIGFNKTRIQYIVACLNNGEPILPPRVEKLEGEIAWNKSALLELAGALFFAVYNQGPTGRDPESPRNENLHSEHREMRDTQLWNDIHAAIHFIGMEVVMPVVDGGYDERYEETCKGIVERDGGAIRVRPIQGFKES